MAGLSRLSMMWHRHLDVTDETAFCLPAIDDIISRGLWQDWADLREAILNDSSILDRVEHICKHYIGDPYSQRYHFWYNYVQKHKKTPKWEEVLSSACRLQVILPGAVLVGGTAAAIYAKHSASYDADHILTDLRKNFHEVLGQLESIAGWRTNRVKEPVAILGSLYGIETGVRQLIRTEPLETAAIDCDGMKLAVPTEAEILRIKSVLVLKRNATRDYLDMAALSEHLGSDKSADALKNFDFLYPQPSGQSALQQLHAQLSNPLPHDLDRVDLKRYKNLSHRWQEWENIVDFLKNMSVDVFDLVCGINAAAPGGRKL